jgi:hypothetical protein
MSTKADGEKRGKQDQLLHKCFHGTESHASLLKLFMQGKGLYSNAFEIVDVEPNQAGKQ